MIFGLGGGQRDFRVTVSVQQIVGGEQGAAVGPVEILGELDPLGDLVALDPIALLVLGDDVVQAFLHGATGGLGVVEGDPRRIDRRGAPLIGAIDLFLRRPDLLVELGQLGAGSGDLRLQVVQAIGQPADREGRQARVRPDRDARRRLGLYDGVEEGEDGGYADEPHESQQQPVADLNPTTVHAARPDVSAPMGDTTSDCSRNHLYRNVCVLTRRQRTKRHGDLALVVLVLAPLA